MRTLRSLVDAEAERLRCQAESVSAVLGTFADAHWTGKAADGFESRLREVSEAARVASARHGQAAFALHVWSSRLQSVQEAADAALRVAQEAEEDLALAQASVGSLMGEHAALMATLRSIEAALSANADSRRSGMHGPSDADLMVARRRADDVDAELATARFVLNDAQERLDAARARAREAQEEFEAGETHFIRELEETLDGAVVTFRAVNAIHDSGPASRSVQGPNDRELTEIRGLIGEANDSVWEMVQAWVSGEGAREYAFGEHDAFTKVFRKSASARQAMKEMTENIRANGHGPGDGDELRFDAKASDLPRDARTIATLGAEGNLPEAFVGSFGYTYTVLGTDPLGNFRVRVHATNVTTVESGTRIPGSGEWPGGPYHLPPYSKLKKLQESGQYADISQEITWVEVVPAR
ncbi:hypothetical protein [Leifsonia sp. NPDC077715]|uniref:hypothetical protein n=1 Tax=Leifsonia sp. NPDC077715 TaxID=3155539 RepID=UPI0034311B2F